MSFFEDRAPKQRCATGQGSRGVLRRPRLAIEPLEDRRMLAAVTVGNNLDLVNGDTSSIANLIASDGGDGISLREAVVAANNTGGSDSIDFSVTGTITLGSQLTLTDSLIIAGPGADQLTISGGGSTRLFLEDGAASITINDVTLTDGNAATDVGGVISSDGGTVNFNRVVMSGNRAGSNGSAVSGLNSVLNITDSAVVNNIGSLTAIYVQDSVTTIRNTTISGNTSHGVLVFNGAGSPNSLSLTNVTIAGNTNEGVEVLASGGGAAVDYRNTILASNGDDGSFHVSGTLAAGVTITSRGYNLLDDTPAGDAAHAADAADKRGTDPILGPLQDNGGTTPTRALLLGSPAIDAGGDNVIITSGLLFNTGVDSMGDPLGRASDDPHYDIFANPGVPLIDEVVPAFAMPPTWVSNDANSNWIGPIAPADSIGPAGEYIYRTTFDLSGFDLSSYSFEITGRWASDNNGTDILINGVSTGQVNQEFASYSDFSINTGFVDGINTLDFVLQNAGSVPSPTGLKVDDTQLIATRLTDQRGLPRPADLNTEPNAGGGDASDIGAFEVQLETPSLNVTTTADVVDNVDMLTSLREAILLANSQPGPDTITFDPSLNGGTITLSSVLGLTESVMIAGPGADLLTISGGATTRLFTSTGDHTITINDLTLTQGNAFGAQGDALLSDGGTVYLNRVVMTDNRGINGSSVAVLNGELNIGDSAVVDNLSSSAAIWSQDSRTAIADTTISGNSSVGVGVFSDSGAAPDSLLLTNVTIVDNSSTGVWTLAGAGTVEVDYRNSILANNGGDGSFTVLGAVANATITSLGYNLLSDTPSGDAAHAEGTADLRDTDPLLGPLQNNGGTTPTRALLPGSLAIDAGGDNAIVVDGLLFNTGVDSSGALLGDLVDDPNYTLFSQPGLADLTGQTVASDGFPVPAPWLPNESDSRWIGPSNPDALGAAGEYVYRTTFDLSGFDFARSSFEITGQWASDNEGTDILINGVSTGQVSSGFEAYSPFTINTGFVSGLNTLDFVLQNDGVAASPTGLRVDDIQLVSRRTTDQRGQTRPVDTVSIPNPAGGNGSDIGAFERQVETPSLTVTTTADVVDEFDMATSLREAVNLANSQSGADTVTFDPSLNGQTITLGSQLVLSETITIAGPGADQLSISGGNLTRLFSTTGVQTVTINDLTLANGNAEGSEGFEGGVIQSVGSTVNFNRVAMTGNRASFFAIGSTIAALNGVLNITDSSVVNNIGSIAAIGAQDTLANITNTTISGNTSSQGIFAWDLPDSQTPAGLNLTNVTVANNGFEGLQLSSGFDSLHFNYQNSIIANNGGAGSFIVTGHLVTITSQGYNLLSDTPVDRAAHTGGAGDKRNTDPMLAPLADNGGPTPTRALMPGSPAIDAGHSPLTTDQRGLPRPVDLDGEPNALGSNASDIGAFEVQAPAPAVRPGDFNGDMVVNAADYTVWRDNLGASSESAIGNNGDGLNGIDQADLDVWRQFYGTSYVNLDPIEATLPVESHAASQADTEAPTAANETSLDDESDLPAFAAFPGASHAADPKRTTDIDRRLAINPSAHNEALLLLLTDMTDLRSVEEADREARLFDEPTPDEEDSLSDLELDLVFAGI